MQDPTPNGHGAQGAGQLSPDGRWRWNGARWLPEPGAGTGFESTYNPLQAGMVELQGWFPRLPRDRPGIALVVQRDNQPLEVVWPSGTGPVQTRAPARGRPRAVYQVDVSDHHLEMSCSLPSLGDAYLFRARLNFTCTVCSPEQVVLRSIRDAGAALAPALEEAMRAASRRHAIEDSAGAEQAVRADLRRREEDDGFHPAFQLHQISVSLDLDPVGRQHADEVRQQRHQRRIDDEQADGEIKRSDRYRGLVQDGEWGMVRLALAQNSGDVPHVLRAMREGANSRFQNNFQALKFLVEERIIGPEDLQPMAELLGMDLTRLLRQPRELPSPRSSRSDADGD